VSRPAAAADVHRLTEDLAQTLYDWGFPRMPARVLMALTTAEDGRLSAAQLAEQLDASAAAISGAVRYLEHLDLVRRSREPGTRHDVFALLDDAWYAASIVKTRMFGEFAALASRTAGAVDGRGDADGRAADRLRDMASYFEFMGSEVEDLLERWNRQRAASR
jgi:DNA-binding transcriptional regulator GbsR (MarR family)